MAVRQVAQLHLLVQPAVPTRPQGGQIIGSRQIALGPAILGLDGMQILGTIKIGVIIVAEISAASMMLVLVRG